MSPICNKTRSDEGEKWDAYLLQVKGDLLHHLSQLSALLANPVGAVVLSPEVVSELTLVRGMIDIYSSRSAEDLEDFKTGFSDLDISGGST
jgi:hypothetical protein